MKCRIIMEGVKIMKSDTNERRHYIDNIRWITVTIVVIYHVIYIYNAEGIGGGYKQISNMDFQWFDSFLYLVYPWFMPILFLVAGISSRLYLEKHTNKEFIKSRTVKLLVPSTIGLFAFQFLQGYVNMSLNNAFESLVQTPKVVTYFIMVLSGTGVLWFIQLLWIYSIILVIIRKIEKDRLLSVGAKTPIWMIILFCLPVWGAGYIFNTPVIVVYRIGFYFVFYILGYFVFSNEKVIEKIKKYAVPFIISGAVLCTIFCIIYFVIKGGANYADAPVNRYPVFAATAYFGSLAMLSGMARFGDFSNKFSEWMSKRSFGLYVFHYLGLSTAALLFAKIWTLPAPLVYLLSLIAGFIFGFGLYAIISRIPIYRWMVLGIKKRR